MKIKHLLFLLLMFVGVSAKANEAVLNAASDNITGGNTATWTVDGITWTLSGGSITWDGSNNCYTLAASTTYTLTWNKPVVVSKMVANQQINRQFNTRSPKTVLSNNDGTVTTECSNYSGFGDGTLGNITEVEALKIKTDETYATNKMTYRLRSLTLTYTCYNAGDDLSSVIVNPGAEEETTGWTGDVKSLESNIAHSGTKVFETAGWWSYTTRSISQTITNLPNGYYTLSAWRMAGTSATCTLTGNGVSVSSIGTGDQGDDRWQKLSVITEVSNNTLQIVASSNSPEGVDYWTTWANFDDFTLTYLGDASATMAVNTTAQYGTFCAPFDVTIPAGVTAYTVSGVEGNALVMNEVTTTIPANTPVILNAEEGLAATSFYGLAVEGTPTVGVLTGVYTATQAESGWYVLQNNDEGVGFYKVNTAVATPTVGANRCYMTVQESGAAPRAFFFGGETTAIETISALVNNEVKEIYNANGVKQNSLQKGMNIIKMSDGSVKKIMVK